MRHALRAARRPLLVYAGAVLAAWLGFFALALATGDGWRGAVAAANVLAGGGALLGLVPAGLWLLSRLHPDD